MDWAFFAVNGLGLNFWGIFEEKNYREKKKGKNQWNECDI